MKQIAVVILNYKLADQVATCVKSVLSSTYKNLTIIVVDNDSHDDIEKQIAPFKEIIFLQAGKNLGYTGGNNVGIKKALTLGADYIFVLNPDTTIAKVAIEKLVEGAEKHNAGLANPKIFFGDKKTLWFAGKRMDLDNVLASHRGVDEQDSGKYDKDEELEDGTGAALLIRRDVFQKIGLFDEAYFLYYEESDFCFRARMAGFKIMYIPSAVVYHKNAQTTGLGSPLQDYYITRNRMLFASKFLPYRTRFALFREGLRNWDNSVRRKAMIDFLLHKFGKGTY